MIIRRLLSTKPSAASTVPARGTWSVRGAFEEAHRTATPVSAAQLADLCRLAQLAAPPADSAAEAQLRRDLGLMLTFVRSVQAAAPPDLAPMDSVSRAAPRRIDEVGREGEADAADARPLPRDVLLANAAATRDGFFLVSDEREPRDANFEPQFRFEPCYSGGKLAVSDDARFFVAPHADAVCLVDTATGRVQRRIEPSLGPVCATLLQAGDQELFLAFDNQMTQQWSLPAAGEDAEAPKLTRSWKSHEAPVRALASDSSLQLLASGGADRTVLVRDVAREHFTHVLRGHAFVVTALAFHPLPARHLLVSGDEGGVLYCWNLADRKGTAVDDAHTSAVTALAITPDGKRAVSAGRDSVLCVWNVTAAGLAVLRQIVTNERVEGLALLNAGAFVAAAGERGFLRVWPLAAGAELRVCDGGGLGEFTSLAASRDGRTLFATTSDLTFARFSVAAKGAVRRERVLIGDNDAIIDACFFGDEQVAVATNSNLVRIIDLETLACTMLAGHTDLVMALAVGGDGSRLVTCAKDHAVRVYELAAKRAPRCIAVCVGHTESVGAVACTSDGALVISGSRDATIKVWRADAPTAALRDDEDEDDDGLVVRDDSRGNEPARPRALTTRSAHDKEVNCVAVSPDDKVVASGSQDRSIRLWRLPKLEAVGQLLGHRRGVWSLRFAPRERLLVSASGDKTLRLWSLADNTCVRAFEGHATPVLRVAFITAGNQLLSTSSDGALKLWNVSDAACVNTFDAHDARPWALAERDDGGQLLTGGEDGALVLWRDRSQLDAAEAASKRAERIVGEQSLLNHERRGDLASALTLAITLDAATRARAIVNRMLDDGAADVPLAAADDDDDGEEPAPPSQLVRCVSALSDELLTRLLLWVRDWHATTRVATAGVRVLRAVLLARSPEQLMAWPETRTALAALIPYAVRHRRRAADLAQRAQLLSYVAGAAGAGSVFAQLSVEQSQSADAVLTIANDDVIAEQAVEAAAARPEHATKRARIGGQ